MGHVLFHGISWGPWFDKEFNVKLEGDKSTCGPHAFTDAYKYSHDVIAACGQSSECDSGSGPVARWLMRVAGRAHEKKVC